MTNAEKTQEKEMGLMDHIRDLRICLLHCSWWILIFTIVAWFYRDEIYHFLWDPYENALKDKTNTKVVYTKIMDPFTLAINQSIVAGILMSSPFIIYEGFKFISPALKQKEIKLIGIYSFISFLLFAGGVYLGYGFMLPKLAVTMEEMQLTGTESYLNASQTMETIIKIILGIGIVFQFPLILFFAVKIGLIKVSTITSNRKIAIVIILTISSIASPPDLISCLIIFVPFYILFEITLICCKLFIKEEEQ